MTSSPSTPPAYRAPLLELLQRLSYKRGATLLASGGRSDFYIDCKQTALHCSGAWLIGQWICDEVRQLRQAGHAVVAVGGLSLGADPLAVAGATLSGAQGIALHAFIIRKQPKDHGTSAWLEGSANLPAGSPVLILEDVVTTGASTRLAVERAQHSGLKPVAIAALVDRQAGGRENLASLQLPFKALFQRDDFKHDAL